MSAYVVEPGDTFERISRREYGTASEAATIRAANPHLQSSGQPIPGVTIEVPDLDPLPAIPPTRIGQPQEEEVAISISGIEFTAWDSVRLSQSIDTPATIAMGAPFEPDSEAFREAFTPLGYKPVTVSVGGSRLFTGQTLTPNPMISPEGRKATIECYARCAALGDCTMPASAYAQGGVEFNGDNILGIANALGKPFGVSASLATDPGAPFERVALEPDKDILGFIIGLCKQRVLVLTSDARGDILLQAETSDEPVADLEESPPLVVVASTFSPQAYWSSVTCIAPSTFGANGVQFTVENPHLTGILRPHVFKADDASNADAAIAAKAKASRMFANAASFTVDLPGWANPKGDLWKPNTRIRLLAPSVMIYKSSLFLIRTVEQNQTKDSSSTKLGLVLPGSYGGEVPAELPWT